MVRHCLECHGALSQKGQLDLSRKDLAMAGGSSGEVIIAGDLESSLLWDHISSGEMPPRNRPRLNEREKADLKKWIEEGAHWSVDRIGPIVDLDERIEKHKEFDCDPQGSGTSDPGPLLLRRLTNREYIETVKATLDVDIQREAAKILPPDTRADGFSNTAYNLFIDLDNVEGYDRLAGLVALRMEVESLIEEFAPCRELSDDCLRQVISQLGIRVLRGPLEQDEIDFYLRVGQAVKREEGDFPEAIRYIVQAMFQSPRFIYLVEDQRGDGQVRDVGPYERASRLSYLVWGGPPDDALFQAAETGKLSDVKQVQAQVERMLADPRAISRSKTFITEWLNLNQLDNLRPNSERFPAWDPQLAADMRAETLAYFEHVVWEEGRPLADLLNYPVTFATPRLAQHYGLPKSVAKQQLTDRWTANSTGRSTRDLEALYTFQEGEGSIVRDLSPFRRGTDLEIAKPSAVEWTSEGLRIKEPTVLATSKSPEGLFDVVRGTGAVTLEAWITPENKNQAGPARILTFSNNTSNRNFTLGQEKDLYDVRFRSSGTDNNGIPGVTTSKPYVETRPTHVVYTREVNGVTKLYIDGELALEEKRGSDLNNWVRGFRLAVGNELTGERPWLGTLHLIAIYSRALTPYEVEAHGIGLVRYDVSEIPARGGLLTQGSVLTVGGDEASMVARGLFVLHDLLSSGVDDPPPCLDVTPVESKPGLSQRGAAEVRLADASCVGCHAAFEPLAFGLEKFDGVGAYHDKDRFDNQLREDGKILIPGVEKPIPYETSSELMDILASSDRIRETLTLKMTQFALGRPLVKTDACHLAKIHAAAQENGGTYSSLITAIATSDLVLKTRTE
ncbi:MAG: DUF1592 domain-containing protein [Pirellulaceae bacterium]